MAFRQPGSARRQQSVVERHPERGARHAPRRRAAHVARRRHRGRAHGHGPVAVPRGCVAGRPVGPGIYDKLIPILQQWKHAVQLRRIVLHQHRRQSEPHRRSVNDDNDWAKSLPYYQAILAMGGEIGTHSYTHLINPPDHDVHGAHRRRHGGGLDYDHPRPACRRSTASRWACGSPARASARTRRCQAPRAKAARSPTRRSPRCNGQHHHHQLCSRRVRRRESGDIGAVPAGTTLTFSDPAGEHQLPGARRPAPTSAATGNPFTYAYEFGQSKTDLSRQLLGTTIYGAAVPGAAETYATPRTSCPISPPAPATPAMSPAAGPASSSAIRARSATSARRSRVPSTSLRT